MASKKKKSAGYDLTYIFIGLAVISAIFTIYIGYRISISERKLLAFSFVPLLLGILLESYRITKDWKIVLSKSVIAYFFSFIAFLPAKKETNYNFDNHIEWWSQAFLFGFLLISISMFKEKTISKLTEGLTLLFSLSFLYWSLDIGFFSLDFQHWFFSILQILCILLILFSLINAFTTIALTKTNRLCLSIWSTIVVVIISVDNIFTIYGKGDLETSKYFSDNLLLGIQYFLLGISAVYVFQNLILLTGFLPDRTQIYPKTLKENVKDHVERYSEEQVNPIDSLICVLYCGVFYYLNYSFSILPRNSMVWVVIISFSLFLMLLNKFKNKTLQK